MEFLWHKLYARNRYPRLYSRGTWLTNIQTPFDQNLPALVAPHTCLSLLLWSQPLKQNIRSTKSPLRGTSSAKNWTSLSSFYLYFSWSSPLRMLPNISAESPYTGAHDQALSLFPCTPNQDNICSSLQTRLLNNLLFLLLIFFSDTVLPIQYDIVSDTRHGHSFLLSCNHSIKPTTILVRLSSPP